MMNTIGHDGAAIHMPGAKSGRAMAVGQQAYAAVAAARDAGLDLPKNAHGFAASAIARGAAPESVFAAIVSPPADDGGHSAGDAVEVAPIDTDNLPAEATVDTSATLGTRTADDEADLPPVTAPDASDIGVENVLSAGASSAEIALETLVFEEIDEVLGLG